MSLLHWVMMAALGAPTGVNFAGDAGAVQNGVLTPKGKAAVMRELKKIDLDHQLTVVACTTDKGVGGRDATALGEAVLAEVKKAMPKLSASQIIRDAQQKDCPQGFVFEVAALPTTNVPQATVTSVTGRVDEQLTDGRMIPVYQGSIVIPGAFILTQGGARCTIQLPEGSTIRVGESSKFSLDSFQKAGTPVRQVKLKLWVGQAWAKVMSLSNGNSKWALETNNAVAGVRGTAFHLVADDNGGTPASQVAVHEGAVVMAAGSKNVAVPEGYGASAKGTTVSDPRPLPAAPTGLQPEKGSFVKETIAQWGGVPGAVAYRVEIASDVQFTDIKVSAKFTNTKAILESPVGTWYWRVIAIDGEGYESIPSQLFKIRFEKAN